jgi:hypothetical protein
VDDSEEEEGVQRGDEDAGYHSSADTLSIHGSEDEEEGEEEEETAEQRGAGERSKTCPIDSVITGLDRSTSHNRARSQHELLLLPVRAWLTAMLRGRRVRPGPGLGAHDQDPRGSVGLDPGVLAAGGPGQPSVLLRRAGCDAGAAPGQAAGRGEGSWARERGGR